MARQVVHSFRHLLGMEHAVLSHWFNWMTCLRKMQVKSARKFNLQSQNWFYETCHQKLWRAKCKEVNLNFCVVLNSLSSSCSIGKYIPMAFCTYLYSRNSVLKVCFIADFCSSFLFCAHLFSVQFRQSSRWPKQNKDLALVYHAFFPACQTFHCKGCL